MRAATIRHLLAHRRRLLGVGLAILIGVAFMTMTMLVGDILRQSFRDAAGSEYRDIAFAIDATDAPLTPAIIDQVASLEGVESVETATAAWIDVSANGRSGGLIARTVPQSDTLRQGLELVDGRLPEQPGEIVLAKDVARNLRLETGDTLTLHAPVAGDPDGGTAERAVAVVGIWSGSGRFGEEEYDTFLVPDDFAVWADGIWTSRLYVVPEAGADLPGLERAVAATVEGTATVRTADELVDAALREREAEVATLERGVQAFALLTLIVAGIVVSNTFAILVAQRTRDIALFRCAGATARQVRQMILGEAVALGAVASIAGVAVGIAVTAIALRVVSAVSGSDSIPSGVDVPPIAVIMPLLAGAILTVTAAWGPARSAMAIDPLQALRMAMSPVGSGERPGPVRAGIAFLLVAAGAMLLLAGIALSHQGSILPGVLVGMAGGCASFLGVLVGASLIVPATVAAFGRLTARLGGVTTRVAAANSVRNPRRTTSTAIALVIGVALVTMMTVGAASLKATLVGGIDAEVPWDVAVTGLDVAGLAAVQADARTLDGVVAGVSLGRIEVAASANGEQLIADARVVNAGDLAETWRDTHAIDGFATGSALVPEWLAESAGIADGDAVEFVVNGAPVSLTVVTTSTFDSVILADADVAATGVTPVVDEFWLRLADDVDADAVIDDLFALADQRGVAIDVTGTSDYRAAIESGLDALLLVTTALLAVAVVIGLIGVANTLTLSVIERTQESALLRALGFTRRQLRRSLAVEGALLAAIGALLGIALGTVYGWIGAATVVGDTWPVALDFPFGRIALIAGIGLICGVLASVLPARRAAQAEPVAALADS